MHKPQPYEGDQRAAADVPAGLDAPDTPNALHMPALNEPAPPPRRARTPAWMSRRRSRCPSPGRAAATPQA